mgnify:CR=1 FL=1
MMTTHTQILQTGFRMGYFGDSDTKMDWVIQFWKGYEKQMYLIQVIYKNAWIWFEF